MTHWIRTGLLALAVAIAIPAPPSAGPQIEYDTLATGTLKGKLIVQWLEPDLFLFIPDATSPLSFTRASGKTITPGRMLTDGGSIPRGMWILRNYSPWGFAPAFIVHDWLFSMKYCRAPGFEQYTVEEAGRVMAEVMKTMIVQHRIDASALTVSAMYAAVVSPPARNLWETGRCNPPPAPFSGKPIRQFELNFDK